MSGETNVGASVQINELFDKTENRFQPMADFGLK